MKKSTKIYVMVIAVILIVFFAPAIFIYLRLAYLSRYYCGKGGTYFPTYGTCEIAAKDAGKKCIYDEECEKQDCLYPYDPEDFGAKDSRTRPYPEKLLNAGGTCMARHLDSNANLCHRSSKDTDNRYLKENSGIDCTWPVY